MLYIVLGNIISIFAFLELIYLHLSNFFLQEIRNTVGNIPMEWYRDYSHIGYDVKGVRIAKPAQGDEVCSST